MRETISNFYDANGFKQYTVIKNGRMFIVECRVNGVITKTIPFFTEQEATSFAQSHEHIGQQLLNEGQS